MVISNYNYERQRRHLARVRPSRWECFKRACSVWVEAFVFGLSPTGALGGAA